MDLREQVADVLIGYGVGGDAAKDVLTALAAAGPSEKMVEAGARALCAEHGYNPDNIIHVQGHTPLKEWMGWRSHARACLTAALAAEGE